jgi:pimeloyl-ACP methyl ester carboxylesterase
MASLIAVYGCIDHRIPLGQLNGLWLGEFRHALASFGRSFSTNDVSSVSFADLLVAASSMLRGKWSSLGDAGLLNGTLQVCHYISDPSCRRKIRERVADRIGHAKAVVIAHSLGSVAAYEALCMMRAHNVHTLITLGSPLGIRQMFFNNLQSHMVGGRRSWPTPLARWVNISYSRDLVPFVKHLSPLFGNGCQIEDVILPSRSFRHAFQSYLSAPVTRRMIAEALYDVGE